eukprot:scaffold14290_cov125-Isochrysis_galbana.AAC.10
MRIPSGVLAAAPDASTKRAMSAFDFPDCRAADTKLHGEAAKASISDGAMVDGRTCVTTDRPPGRGLTSEARHFGLTMPTAGFRSIGRRSRASGVGGSGWLGIDGAAGYVKNGIPRGSVPRVPAFTSSVGGRAIGGVCLAGDASLMVLSSSTVASIGTSS